ncbi:unnamed protein product [Clonostachys rosea]|uniref:Uncharacterized protein n=1 Tax=Bionectria ochroleuca TaxID=29856 RepID=A0ABY6UGD4_BIOOC|nr:unnamed protein product [Clonostachys rosea]
MASKSGSTDDSADYLTKTDGFYRAFLAACKEGIKDRNRGPNVAQYLGFLMTRPGYSENDPPQAWQAFVTAEPEIASMLRRSAAEFRVSIDGELVKFNPVLEDKKRVPLKFLVVSNPDHVMGAATFQDASGALVVSEKTDKDKPRKPRGKQKVVRIRDEDDHGVYDYDDTVGY